MMVTMLGSMATFGRDGMALECLWFHPQPWQEATQHYGIDLGDQ
jgi:hypothetical protein